MFKLENTFHGRRSLKAQGPGYVTSRRWASGDGVDKIYMTLDCGLEVIFYVEFKDKSKVDRDFEPNWVRAMHHEQGDTLMEYCAKSDDDIGENLIHTVTTFITKKDSIAMLHFGERTQRTLNTYLGSASHSYDSSLSMRQRLRLQRRNLDFVLLPTATYGHLRQFHQARLSNHIVRWHKLVCWGVFEGMGYCGLYFSALNFTPKACMHVCMYVCMYAGARDGNWVSGAEVATDIRGLV